MKYMMFVCTDTEPDTDKAADTGLIFPAMSVAVAVMLCVPAVRAVVVML